MKILRKVKLATIFSTSSFVVILFAGIISTSLSNNVYGKSSSYQRNNSALINRISGFVFDEKRNPIAEIYVELQDELYRSVNRIKTDGSGRYVFAGMSEGNYYVHVIPTQGDFEEQIVRVEVVNLGPQGGSFGRSDDVTLDVYLRTKKKDSDILNEPGVVFAQDIPRNAQSLYEKSLSLFNQKNDTDGIKSLQEAIAIFPTYYLALNRLGYAYFEQKKFDLASEYFAKAADINPKSEPTIYLLSYSVFLTKRYDAAITMLQGALDLQHSTLRIHLLLGNSFRAIKKYEDAEKEFKKAQSLDTTKTAEPNWELALLYGNNLKRFKEAADQLELFLKLQPNAKNKDNVKKLIKQFREKEKAG